MEIVVTLLAVALVLVSAVLVFTLKRLNGLEKTASVSVKLDSMTGLPNREGFMRMGAALLGSAKAEQGLTMFIFDVEELGKINTLFGTDIGDNVIKAFAETIRAVSGFDSVVGRVNTDDFALLTSCGGEDAKALTERFGEILREKLANPALSEQVGFYAGVCEYDGQDDIYTLYNKANLCLIMRKDGCRVTTFTHDMEHKMVETELLRSEMLAALENGQFELYYQPKISFKTGEMRGVEALIRWHHPTKGFVPPNEFIPLAEKTGIITKIDEWGLFTACRQCKKWQDEGYTPVKVSVNMSQAQFYRTDVFMTISEALAETGLDPKWLEIEVTETMAMQDIDRTISVLGKIRSLGVSISMDDFGSGYSSLSSLKTIPLDILKIDRSLVCDLDENNVSKKITGAIVELGKAMKLIVLAEGVETSEQNAYLTEIGCDLAQGFYYSKPRPASEIETLMIAPIVGHNYAAN